MAQGRGNLIIRIALDPERLVDWHVQSPTETTFQDVLDVITEASNDQLFVTAFEYKDEDGDRITVKSDDELHAMINFHLSTSYADGPTNNNNGEKNLMIYPKTCKHPKMRNKHDLKVAIAPTASSLLLADTDSRHASFHNGTQSRTQGQYSQHQNQNFMPEMNASSAKQAPRQALAFQFEALGNDALVFLEILGNGHSGVVRKAVHRASNTLTAVKAITLDLTGAEQQQILRELEILRRCNGCPNIIAFYGAYFDENRVLLCTEFMDGGSLERYGTVPESVLVHVASSISFGLRHLWGLRIMHRDVKPSNVLVNTSGHIKLCDFGVSTQLVDSIARTYIGTNAYMAPERIIGHDYTIYSDVWSFGISVCELATGMFPYPQLASKIEGSKGILPMELMQCIVNEPSPKLPTDQFSQELVSFTKCCLHKEAAKRMLPDQLCMHPLVVKTQAIPQQHVFGIVSGWIQSKLQKN